MSLILESSATAAAAEASGQRAVYDLGAATPPRTLLDIFRETVSRHPSAAAIDDGTTVLTYRQLAEEVDTLRDKLAAAGIGVGGRVGVRVSSGRAELYVAILGVLAAGAAYVPVDADDPDERAELVFEEAGAGAVLGDDGALTPLPAGGGVPVERAVEPADDAWIIFTSGSTGKPKGVAVSHRSAAAFVDAEARLFLQPPTEEPLGPADRVLAGLSVAFDASCEEMWLAWRHGACLVPAPRSLVRTGVDLGPWLLERGVTVVSTVPTLAALWPADALDEVRLLIFGGEACPAELAERVAVEGREVWNTYGPTEATVVACAARLTGDEPVRIGLPLAGWQLAVVGADGLPVATGETGELIIGGVGLARYLDAAKDAEKFVPLPALGWSRAYRSGDVVRADAEGLVFVGRGDEQVKLGGRRIELGEVDAALQALPEVVGAACAVQKTPAGNQILVGYVVASGDFDAASATDRLRLSLPAALVPLVAVVDNLPTRTSGKVDRAALPWPLSIVDPAADDATRLPPTQAWLASRWSDILGVRPTDGSADFFTSGGGSITAAQLVAAIRERHPRVAVVDIYQNPTLAALAAVLDDMDGTASTRADVAPTPRLTGFWQTLLMIPLLTVVGLRWATVAAAIGNLLSVAGIGWAPTVSWPIIAAGWLLLFSPPGRIALSAGVSRLLLRDVRPGAYPRGGSVHLRLWFAERLAELSGVTNVSGASWMTHYAKALGAKVGKDVDLHSPPPVTGLLKLGRGAAIEPEVDLSGHWVDGDVVRIGKIRVGAGARIGGRTTLLPGARIGKGAEIAAGSTVRGSVPAGQSWAGSPAGRSTTSTLKWPTGATERKRFWSGVYGVTSQFLGLVPVLAALPAVSVFAWMVAGTATIGSAVGYAMAAVPLVTSAYLGTYALIVLVGVRALSIGMRAGYHPVHGRLAWQVWATERLMDLARVGLFPLYASLFTPVWLRLLGAKIGRGVEASTVLAVPKMTQVDNGAFLADDTMVATYELGHGWLHVGPARIGKRAFLGNSGMTAGGRSVPKKGLVGVLSSTPSKAKKGSSWLGMPPMALRRSVDESDSGRTFRPARRLKVARAVVECCRVVPVMCSVALAVLVTLSFLAITDAYGLGVAVLSSGFTVLAAGLAACALTTTMKWLLIGRFRAGERPLWSSFVWRNELADTFVEVVAVPWLIGAVAGTPLLPAWLRTMGAKIGRGAWLETYWLPESDLVRIGAGATVNRGCVVQTHLFHDRIMRMDTVLVADGATLGPHGIVLPGAEIGARTTVGPGSLVTRGDAVPSDSGWQGNPISTWSDGGRRG